MQVTKLRTIIFGQLTLLTYDDMDRKDEDNENYSVDTNDSSGNDNEEDDYGSIDDLNDRIDGDNNTTITV